MIVKNCKLILKTHYLHYVIIKQYKFISSLKSKLNSNKFHFTFLLKTMPEKYVAIVIESHIIIFTFYHFKTVKINLITIFQINSIIFILRINNKLSLV